MIRVLGLVKGSGLGTRCFRFVGSVGLIGNPGILGFRGLLGFIYRNDRVLCTESGVLGLKRSLLGLGFEGLCRRKGFGRRV